jgi:hypothetical protein
MSTAATVQALRAFNEDFEWYPTTAEIITKVVDDINEITNDHHWDKIKSVMDIGAGDGRVLKAIQESLKEHSVPVQCYAIEKAIHHLNNMPKDITVVGTDFEQQTLVDKRVSVIFCNPPYSQFEDWTLRIIREASTSYIYLVIPQRWRDSAKIKHELELRSAEVETLGDFDFEDADRQARAKVEVIRIGFDFRSRDAFDTVIQDMLPELDVFKAEMPKAETSTEIRRNGRNLVDVLVDDYNAAMVAMIDNYKAALKLSRDVLFELGVDKDSVLGNIKMKIQSMKDRFWKKLFDEMGTITQRLATRQRRAFLESLREKVSIDFTANNVYAVLIWISKCANDHFDQQLIDLFQTLSNDSNVVRYKCNERVWTKNGWGYRKFNFNSGEKGAATHYRLEYRMVISHGGIASDSKPPEQQHHRGLQERSFALVDDMITVANNLGFSCNDSPRNYVWTPNKQHKIKLADGRTLVAVRAFKNGNMHVHFDPKVMLAINVEAGRLLRWIRNPAEACQEMEITGNDAKQVEKMFGASFRISPENGFLRLTSNQPDDEQIQSLAS